MNSIKPSASHAVYAARQPAGSGSVFARLAQPNHLSLLLILSLGVVSLMDAMIVGALLTPIKAEFSFSDEQLGRMSSLFTLAGIVGAPVFGLLAGRFGRKRVLLSGVLVWSIASLLTGTAAGLLGLLLWRALTGFGEAAYNSIAPGWLADLYRPRWRNFVFSLYMVKNKIGTAAALALGGWLAARYGWRTAFFVAGVPGILLALSLSRVTEPAIGATDDPPAGGARALAQQPIGLRDSLAVFGYRAYLLHLTGLVFFYTAMSVQIWIPAFLHRAHALPNQQASAFLAQVLLFTLPAGLIGGFLSSLWLQKRRWGFPAFLAATSVLTAAAMFEAYTAPDLARAQLFIALGTAAFGFSAGTLTTLVVETVPARLRNSATALSVVLTSGVAGIVSPELVGLLSDAHTLQRAVLLAPACYLLAGLVWTVYAIAAARGALDTHRAESSLPGR